MDESVEWREIYPQRMPEGQAFVAISDGTCTHCAASGDLDAMIEAYKATYVVNSPGEVRCTAALYPADWDGEAAPQTARSFRFQDAVED